jgi:pimeloyl-ACP methyl ester carboxylesterase
MYLIPGMACDGRLLQYLRKHLEFETLEFLEPEPNETLEHYASRMAQGIDTSAPFYVGGVSFGGMVATAIHQQFPALGLVYISSAKVRRELPPWLRVYRWIPIQRWLGPRMLRRLWPRSPLPRAGEHKALMAAMRRDINLTLFKWSMDRAACMSNTQLPTRWIHVHGTRDLLLPGMFIRGAIKIKGGDHGMVMAKAEEIAGWVREWMGEKTP